MLTAREEYNDALRSRRKREKEEVEENPKIFSKGRER